MPLSSQYSKIIVMRERLILKKQDLCLVKLYFHNFYLQKDGLDVDQSSTPQNEDMEDGDIIPLEKVRTTEKAIEKLFEFVAEFDNLEQTAIIQPSKQPNKQATALQERLQQSFPNLRFPIIQYGPDLATRVGPNAMGIVVYEGMTF